jgi:hypothetical protein
VKALRTSYNISQTARTPKRHRSKALLMSVDILVDKT